jgi:superfamily II DNA or RNA helicase
MKKAIRPYQQQAIRSTIKDWKGGEDKLLLAMATGTGKTFTAVEFIKEFKKEVNKDNFRTLWGTHTEELIEQSSIALLAELDLMPYDKLTSTIVYNGGLLEILRSHEKGNIYNDERLNLIAANIGVVKADLFQIDKPIVVASMQTLWRRLDKIGTNHFDLVVADECHLFGAKTFNKSLEHFQPLLRFGLSATPYRQDGMLLGDIFDKITFEYPIDVAIREGYLCEIDAVRVKTDISLDQVRTTAGELNQGDLEVVINTPERNKLIVEKYKQFASGRQFIAFCNNVQHAMDLNATFTEAGVNTNFVVGDKKLTTDRKGIIADFKAGKYVGLVNVAVLTAGFDHPNTGCIIMASPTKSINKYLQQIGRGTRLKDEAYVSRFKQNCIVLDFLDSTRRHRLVNTFTLDKAKRIEDKTFMTTEQKEGYIAKRDATAVILQQDKDSKVNLLKLPKPKIIKSIRMKEPATEKQLAWIEKLGYSVKDTNYTKAMCSEIISAQPVKDWQEQQLARWGYDVSQGATLGEYSKARKSHEEKEIKERLAKELAKGGDNFSLFNDM